MQKVTGIFYFFGRGETCPPSLQTLWQWADRLALQRCTQNAGKRFTFAVGQYRERRCRCCGNAPGRTARQRCTQNAGKRFTFATGQYRERRYGSCGNGQERPMLQRCT